MEEPSVSTMESWLRAVVEAERWLIVADSAISDINSKVAEVKQSYCVRKLEKPKTSKSTASVVTMAIGAFLAVVGFMLFGDAWDSSSPLILVLGPLVLLGILSVGCGLAGIVMTANETDESARLYERQKEAYESAQASYKRLMSGTIPQMNHERNALVDTRRMLRSKLDELYAANYLDKRYRNLAATAAMLGYLTSKRCTVIYGHGGIIDTFVHDSQFEIINGKLDSIIARLDEIRYTQTELVSALNRNSSELAAMRRSIDTFSSQMHRDNERILACERWNSECLSWISSCSLARVLEKG